ncbi:hypothetical protein C1H46_045854 [Malus baccata]|uniref:Uncharacterized protein n=1 Tax=Malus baccata TaxID=106549 RepID=A0A540K2V8_MALBA|nr:hypothetical protein C1H46_045854 [Malus baccata]
MLLGRLLSSRQPRRSKVARPVSLLIDEGSSLIAVPPKYSSDSFSITSEIFGNISRFEQPERLKV